MQGTTSMKELYRENLPARSLEQLLSQYWFKNYEKRQDDPNLDVHEDYKPPNRHYIRRKFQAKKEEYEEEQRLKALKDAE